MGNWNSSFPIPENAGQEPWIALFGHAGFSGTRIVLSYVLAVVSCLGMTTFRLGIGYQAGDPPMLMLYIIPIIGTAYAGGLVPGLFSTALSGLMAALYILDINSLFAVRPDKMLNLATLLISGTVICILVESLHRLRHNIERSLEQYRIVADNTYDWEFWIDPQGRSLYQSPSCQRITGHGAAEFMADPGSLQGIVHPDDMEAFLSHRHGVVSEKAPGSLEFRILRPDGDLRWIEHFCLPVFGRDGAYLGARGSNSDITERKRMEEVVVRTEKLMSVGVLAAGMAHEINNPLGGIMQNLQNVKRRFSPELPANSEAAARSGTSLEAVQGYLADRNIPGFLDAIEASGRQAAAIVEKMLDFCGTGTSAMVVSDVNALVEKALDFCATDQGIGQKCHPTGIAMVRDFDQDAPEVRCVPSQMEQALVNLLVNAVQALNEAGARLEAPRMTVRTRKMGDQVRIEVEDNGPGMDENVLRQAFDPFFTTRAPGCGAGLGLSVSYYIVANHKGSLSARSAPGQGATFTVELKAA